MWKVLLSLALLLCSGIAGASTANSDFGAVVTWSGSSKDAFIAAYNTARAPRNDGYATMVSCDGPEPMVVGSISCVLSTYDMPVTENITAVDSATSPAPSHSSSLPLTGDILIGCAIALSFGVGWIAGGQR